MQEWQIQCQSLPTNRAAVTHPLPIYGAALPRQKNRPKTGIPLNCLIAFNSNVYGLQVLRLSELRLSGVTEPTCTQIEATGAPKLELRQENRSSRVI
jgi:hypothetical protein